MISLGATRNSRQYRVAAKDLLHLLVVGPTGTGKSRFLLSLIQQLLLLRDQPSIIFIDPVGDSYDHLISFVSRYHLEEKTILFNPADDDGPIIGYNPMQVNDLPISYRAAAKVLATLTALKLHETESVLYMPQLKIIFYNLYYALMETGLTLVEAEHLLANLKNPYREAIISQIKTRAVQDFWQMVEQLPAKERKNQLGLAQARLHPFLSSEPIRRILSQQKRALNFNRLLEDPKLLLCNLQPFRGLTPEDTRLLGTMIVEDTIAACFSRQPSECKDVFLVIDEFQDMVTPDIGKIMREGRHYKLHLVLATQGLQEMREEHKVLYHRVLGNATHKVVFGDLSHEDLELLAPELFLEEICLEERKLEIYRTFFEPRESQRAIRSFGASEGSGVGQVAGSGIGFRPGEGLLADWEEASRFESSGESSFWGIGAFESETIAPFYEYLKRQELASVQFRSLQEHLHKAKAKLKSLGKREIALKARGQKVQFLKTPLVADIPFLPQYVEQTKDKVFSKSGCYSTIEEIQQEEQARLKKLTHRHGSIPTHYPEYDHDD